MRRWGGGSVFGTSFPYRRQDAVHFSLPRGTDVRPLSCLGELEGPFALGVLEQLCSMLHICD